MKKKNLLRNWLILIILLVLIYFGVKGYWSAELSPVNKSDGAIKVFVIGKGESTSSIVARLKQENLIRSELFFKYLIKQTGSADKIQAGDFKLSPNMTSNEILNTLQSGSLDKWVTFIEGWRVEEMANELNSKLKIPSSKFVEAAKKYEGRLFPDTYLINPEMSIPDIISLLNNTFNQRYDSVLRSKIKNIGLTEEQGIILASIVEREARSDEVRTKVASILLKRFKIGMALNADATVRYAKDTLEMKGKDNFKFWQAILQSDYQDVKSPYNTYLHSGLPPTPICNPSLSALKAVANADPSTPYLYYYHDSKGNSYYGKTLEEHNQNVQNHP